MTPTDPQAIDYCSPTVGKTKPAESRTMLLLVSCVGLLLFPVAIASLILGILADRKAKRFGLSRTVPKAAVAMSVISLLVGVAIVILFANAMDNYRSFIRCKHQLMQIGLSLAMYAETDSNGHAPPDLTTLAATAALPASLYVCPGSPQRPSTAPDWPTDIFTGSSHCSYVYLIPPGRRFDSLPPEMIILLEPIDHHVRGSHVLYADGHSEYLDAENLRKEVARSLQLRLEPVSRK